MTVFRSYTHSVKDIWPCADTSKLKTAYNSLIRKIGCRSGIIRGAKTEVAVGISWNGKRNHIKKPKFLDELGEVMGLVQENFMGVSAPGDAEPYITACRSAGVRECLIHSVKYVINVGAAGETNKTIIDIYKKNNSMSALGRIVRTRVGIACCEAELMELMVPVAGSLF